MLALHQAGLKTAVASMGTALTPAQLKELRRLTPRLYLCFDADAAGEAATLRGMDLAYRDFDEVRVVPLAPGSDPAEEADRFAERIEQAEPYPRYRVKLEIDAAKSKAEAFARVREVLSGFDQDTEWMDAIQYAANSLDLHRTSTASWRRAPRADRRDLAEGSRGGDRLERDALAGAIAHPSLVDVLAELSDDHFERSSTGSFASTSSRAARRTRRSCPR